MGLSWFIFGFMSAFAGLVGAVAFYFLKLLPKLTRKYRSQRAELAERAQAAGQPFADGAATDESLEWISSLLARFWKTIRESDAFLGPLHMKVEKRLRDGLAKVPAGIRQHMSDVQFSLKPGAALPPITHAQCSGDNDVEIRFHFGGAPPSNGKQPDDEANPPCVFLAELETSVLLPFDKLKIPSVLLPVRARLSLASLTGCLALSNAAYPSHEMHISMIGLPTIDWDIQIEIGSFRLHRFLFDTLRLRTVVDDLIAAALLKKIVAPNRITTRIPLSPTAEELAAIQAAAASST